MHFLPPGSLPVDEEMARTIFMDAGRVLSLFERASALHGLNAAKLDQIREIISGSEARWELLHVVAKGCDTRLLQCNELLRDEHANKTLLYNDYERLRMGKMFLLDAYADTLQPAKKG